MVQIQYKYTIILNVPSIVGKQFKLILCLKYSHKTVSLLIITAIENVKVPV